MYDGSSDPRPPLKRRPRAERQGRHRRPERPALPDEPPTLLLAVPAAPEEDAGHVVREIAVLAGAACPGVSVRVGYLHGEPSLASVLADVPAAVAVVPLLPHGHPGVDDVLQTALAGAGRPAVVSEPLGPHPLLAEIMHERLAEAGLVRADRVRLMSVAGSGADSIVVAAGGAEGADAVGVTAVLLAARLAVRVLPATVDDTGGKPGIGQAVDRLRAEGAAAPVVVPCLIGLGPAARQIAEAAAAAQCPCAAPFGSHHRIADLIALRYQEAVAALT